jgi:hypothetical protein
MANISTPFGFKQIGYVEGFVSNYAMSTRKISSGNGTAIFRGDCVTSLSSGYITQSTPSTTQIAGIFQGCEYLSLSQGIKIRSKFWPGSDANGDVTAYLIDNPYAEFLTQVNGTPILLASVGLNGQFAQTQAGSTTTGYSGQQLDTTTNVPAVTGTFPFRIRRLASDGLLSLLPAGSNGSDNTTNFNMCVVTFNFQDLRSTTGI